MSTIERNGMVINLDSKDMEFNETNLNEYIQKEGPLVNRKGQELADLEFLLTAAEDRYDALYTAKFSTIKDGTGGSDKLVDAKVRSDPEMVKIKEEITALKRDVTKMKQHLKAWDKNHENAMSFGHNLRREMEKLGSDIRFRSDPDLEDRLNRAMNNG
jgi:hypothetical protein